MSARRRIFYAYEKFREGVMPESGGLLEQSAILIEQFQVCESAVAGVKLEQAVQRRNDTDGD